MPIETALSFGAIVAVFATFGIVLAWAERRTRRIDPP
jgi:hypothetical protein